MQKYRILGYGLVFLFFACATAAEKSKEKNYPQLSLPKVQLSFCGNNYVAWVATKNEELSRGLMNFRPLKAREAMLFIHPEEEALGFWMKNVPYDLDIVFFSKDKKLVSQTTMLGTSPMMNAESLPTYRSEGPALYAVEVRGQSLKKLPKDCRLSIH